MLEQYKTLQLYEIQEFQERIQVDMQNKMVRAFVLALCSTLCIN